METLGYVAGKGTKMGKWIIEDEHLKLYYQSRINGLFMGLGALGGALSALTGKEKAIVDIPLNTIKGARFEKFRLNNKSIFLDLLDDTLQIIVDEPDKWLIFFQEQAKKNSESNL